MIKDSGERKEFESGAVRDVQKFKGRCDLLPLDVVYVLRPDEVIACINNFQKTGNPKHLINALNNFAEKYDSFETMILEVSIHFEEGAEKYGAYNWQKGLPAYCYINSAIRHYLKYLRGDEDERHDRAFVWNILCCIWTCYALPKLNDYKSKEESTDD